MLITKHLQETSLFSGLQTYKPPKKNTRSAMSKYTVSLPLSKNDSLFDESFMRILYPFKTYPALYWINGLLVIPSANYVDVSCLYTCSREIYVLLTFTYYLLLREIKKTLKTQMKFQQKVTINKQAQEGKSRVPLEMTNKILGNIEKC